MPSLRALVPRQTYRNLVMIIVVLLVTSSAATRADRGRLSVVITDALGTDITAAATVELWSYCREGRSLGRVTESPRVLEYGTYCLSVQAPAFIRELKEIRVYSKDVLAVVSLQVGSHYPEKLGVLRGRVSPPPNGRGESVFGFVKVIPIFGQHALEARVERNGEFLLVGFDSGMHICAYVSSGRVLAQRTIMLFRNADQTIELPVEGGIPEE